MELKRMITWWDQATPGERARLARAMKTSQHYLRSHLMVGDRRASAEYASRMEAAISKINSGRPQGDKLPEIDRRDLCAACASCPFGAFE